MQDKQIIEGLNQIGLELRRRPLMKQDVMRRIAEKSSVGGIASRRRLTRRLGLVLVGIAACLVVVCGLLPLRNGDGAREAFATAINDVAKARTFSCRQIATRTGADGKEETTLDESVMFKEPDRERRELIATGAAPQGQITITDYGRHRQLVLLEKDKMAALEDISSEYYVDAMTGELKPAKIDMFVRDDVMKITAQAVVDLGVTKLDGRDVRQLKSKEGEPVKTVYVDSKTGLPVQILLSWPSEKRTWTYASIEIDADMGDSLFSLDVPQGHKLWRGGLFKPDSDYYSKMMTKMRFLVMQCHQYAGAHGGDKGDNFPETAADLTQTGLNAKALATVLAAPETPNGPPMIAYHKPRAGKDWNQEIIFYEVPGQQRDGMVAAAMVDGHAEVLMKEQFEKLMK